MFDIQPDSPVPVHEQIAGQVVAHVASEALKAGARLPEYRALSQQLLTHPQVVARAYADLEWEGVLTKSAAGGMEVTSDAAVICRIRQRHRASERLRQVVAQARTDGLDENDIRKIVEQALAQPLQVPAPIPEAAKNPTHVSSDPASQGIQVLPQQTGRGSPQPERAGGGDIRPARR
jgi:DNA-binding transcriptional regulator YhcF (GntR family)